MDPFDYLKFKRNEILTSFTRDNRYSSEKAEEVIQTMNDYLNQISLVRFSNTLTIEKLTEIEQLRDYEISANIEEYILRSIKDDNSYIHAYNYLTKKGNRGTGLSSPIKDFNEAELFNLLHDDESKNASGVKTYLLIKDDSLIRQVFDACDNSFSCEYEIFLKGIQTADFTLININKKNQVQHLTYRLSFIMEREWYTKICKNMNWEKGDCSGQNTKIGTSLFARKIDKLLPIPSKDRI